MEVLQWLRNGDDPCPWSLSRCKEVAIAPEMQEYAEETIDWIESQAKAGVESDCDDEFDDEFNDEFEHDWDDDDEYDSVDEFDSNDGDSDEAD